MKGKRTPKRLTAAAVAAAAAATGTLLGTSPASAADDQWTSGSGNWSTPGNWGLGAAPNISGSSAVFGTLGLGTVTLDANETVGLITFNNGSASYTIAGANTLRLDNSGSAAAITVLAGTDAINTSIGLTSFGVTVNAAAATNLTLAGVISGAGGLTKTGTGTLTLTAPNAFTGGTTVNAGTLQVTAAGTGATPLGTGPVAVNSGGTLVGGNADAFGYAGGAAPASIAINGGTVTDLGSSNYRVTLPNLTFTGGTLTSASGNTGDQYGTFSFYGNGSAATVTRLASSATATISGGSVSLEEPTTFNVAAGTTARNGPHARWPIGRSRTGRTRGFRRPRHPEPVEATQAFAADATIGRETRTEVSDAL